MRARAHRRRLLPDGGDHAALGGHRQHPARRRSRWSASTSTRPRSPSSPTAGPRQARGIVTDVGLFLEQLAHRAGARVPTAIARRRSLHGRAHHVGGADGARLRPQRAASRTGGTMRCAAPTRDRSSASRAGPSNRSPAADTPPPTTTTSGSSAATRLATPDAEPVTDHGERLERPPGRPSCGGRGDHRAGQGRSGLPPQSSVSIGRLLVEPGPGVADQRVAAGVLLPAAPPPHSHAWPSGTTCMWPNSPGHAVAPRGAPGRR